MFSRAARNRLTVFKRYVTQVNKKRKPICVMLYLPKQTTHKGGFLMKSITQDIRYYQAILSYADKHGVTKAAIKYRTYRQFICRLRNRYDGTPESLAPKPRRPPSTPQRTLRQRDRSHSADAQTSSQYRLVH